jgi:tetratricopeptide (TPR) repeat protein
VSTHPASGLHLRCGRLLTRRSAISLLFFACFAGCTVESNTRLLEEKAAIADPYFTGTFDDSTDPGKVHRIHVRLNGKRYIVELENNNSLFVTLHKFRRELLVGEDFVEKSPREDRPYHYWLMRKTAQGFEVGNGCPKAELCKAATRQQLLHNLDLLAAAYLRDPKYWLPIRRGTVSPTDQVVQNPSADCNSDEKARMLSGCSALIAQGTLNGIDLALAHSRRSDAFIGSRDFDRVISDRKRAVELQPNDAAYKMRLSGAYQLRATVTAKRSGDDAAADLTEAIRVDPSNYEARVQRSTLFVAQRKLAQAIEDAEEVLKVDATPPNSEWLTSLLVQRASELLLSSDIQGAIAVLTRAIQLAPTNPELLVQRGNAHSAKGDHGLAIVDYSDALRLRPNYIEALLYRADMYSRTGQPVRSLSDADSAVKLDGKNAIALLARAFAREANADYESARADYAKVLALDPKQLVAKAGIERARQQQEASTRLEQLSREQSLLTEASPTTNVALAPTFNCSKAAGLDETTICNDRALAFLDRELGATFRRVQTRPMASGDSQLLKQQQVEWLRQRGQCQNNTECIAELYRSRILELQNWTPFME